MRFRRERRDQFAETVLPIIASLQKAGVTSLRGIAIALNNRGVRTARGGEWQVSNVRNLLGQNAGTRTFDRREHCIAFSLHGLSERRACQSLVLRLAYQGGGPGQRCLHKSDDVIREERTYSKDRSPLASAPSCLPVQQLVFVAIGVAVRLPPAKQIASDRLLMVVDGPFALVLPEQHQR